MITHRFIRDTGPDVGRTAPADGDGSLDRHKSPNAVALVCLHAGLSALLLALLLPTALPLLAAAGLAWFGGACATVALLLAHDTVTQSAPLALTARAPRRAATAPDL